MLQNLIPLIVLAAVAAVGAWWLRWVIANFDYQCGNCGGIFSVPPFQSMIVPHWMGSKLVRCPHCGRVTWAKPVPK